MCGRLELHFGLMYSKKNNKKYFFFKVAGGSQGALIWHLLEIFSYCFLAKLLLDPETSRMDMVFWKTFSNIAI